MVHSTTKNVMRNAKDGSISKRVITMPTMKHHEIANIERAVLVFHALIL
jgi:hypothetical protein